MDISVSERVQKIKMLILDIDGVLTDGRMIYSAYGEELKSFDVHDGLGLVLLRRAGIRNAIITARKSRIVKARCKDLGSGKVYHGYPNKLIPFKRILWRFRVKPEEVCFIGDDIIDLPVLRRVGFAVAVSNAVEEVKKNAHYTTTRSGGRGAVREVCDLILKTQGKWGQVTSLFFA